MAALSKLHDKCEKCKYKDNCNNKRMVACGMIEMSKANTGCATTENCTSKTINIDISAETNNRIAQHINKAFQVNCRFR